MAYFEVSGKPQGKARARTVRNKKTGKTHSFTPKNTVEYEEHVKQCFLTQTCGRFTWFNKEPLEIHITAFFPVPKSTSKRTAWKMVDGEILPTKKPDADNIAKAICDALNGVAYGDDSQIVSMKVVKKYTDLYPRVQVYLKGLGEK